MVNSILVSFGKRVSLLRKSKGMTQEGLAICSGLHRTHIGMIERAERDITLSSISKLAKGFEMTMHELLKF
jgi:XRE family transcriptional regulator, regulator of sulfur utilization